MITEKDLDEAIAECQGQRNPNSSTCVKLAAFYTIKDRLFPTVTQEPVFGLQQSFDSAPAYSSNTEFGILLSKVDLNDALSVIDEMMTTLLVVNPKLYRNVMDRIEKLNHTH